MKRMTRIISILAALLMSLGAVTSAYAALAAFSPNPARLNGVNVGGLPAWYQDQNGVAVDPCFDVANCGLAAAAEPGVFDPALPLVFPSNFPSEAFYFAADATISLGPAAAPTGSALVRTALEYTFVNPVTGALTTPRTPGALGAPFMRFRIVETIPGGGGVLPAGATGSWTLTTPWGVTTFLNGDAKCVNQGGDTKCSMTQDLPAPGAIPPNFAAALGTGVPGSISAFLKSSAPVPPTGFLGNGAAAISAVTTDTPPVTATFALTDALGNSGSTGAFGIILGKITGLEVQPGANHNFGAVIIDPAPAPAGTSAIHTVTVTNTTGFAVTFPADLNAVAVKTGVDAGDFIIDTLPPTVVPAIPNCAGATLQPANLAVVPIIPGQSCGFDMTFKPAAAAKAARVANLLLAPTAALPANNPPPINMALTGTAHVKITTAVASPHGTVVPDATVDPVTGGAPAGSPVTFTVTPTNKKFKIKDVADGAALLTPSPTNPAAFTLANTGLAAHTVTATFMQSGDLDADGFVNVNDALKALRIVAGVQQADGDDLNNTAVKVAPLTNGVPAALDAKPTPDIGDVLVILRRALNLDTW